MERTVRPAGPRDAPAAAALLAAAFIDDPVMDWIQPVRSQRTPLLKRLFAVQLSHEYLPAGGVRVIDSPDGQPLAGAMWKPPTIATVGGTRREQISMAAALVAALRTRLPAALVVRRALDSAHPAEPHWYLNKIGTAPSARGQGLASALLSAQVRHCDETTRPAYLECTRQTLIGFYEQFGFTATESIVISDGGPRIWGMWRPPG